MNRIILCLLLTTGLVSAMQCLPRCLPWRTPAKPARTFNTTTPTKHVKRRSPVTSWRRTADGWSAGPAPTNVRATPADSACIEAQHELRPQGEIPVRKASDPNAIERRGETTRRTPAKTLREVVKESRIRCYENAIADGWIDRSACEKLRGTPEGHPPGKVGYWAAIQDEFDRVEECYLHLRVKRERDEALAQMERASQEQTRAEERKQRNELNVQTPQGLRAVTQTEIVDRYTKSKPIFHTKSARPERKDGQTASRGSMLSKQEIFEIEDRIFNIMEQTRRADESPIDFDAISNLTRIIRMLDEEHLPMLLEYISELEDAICDGVVLTPRRSVKNVGRERRLRVSLMAAIYWGDDGAKLNCLKRMIQNY